MTLRPASKISMSFMQSNEKALLKSFQSSDESDAIDLDYEAKYQSFDLGKMYFKGYCDYSTSPEPIAIRVKFTHSFFPT